MTNDPRPVILNQLNLVVRDVPTSVAFYRRLGLAIEEAAHPDWAAHHATAIMPNGMRLEFDSLAFASQWNPGWRGLSGSGLGVVFFGVPERQDVDDVFERMREAGYAAQKPPEDAFWGARYAIIEDPDGNAVGIMSSIDPARQFQPPPPSG
jgi:catechol 2,3-dioxygenase-like lactoylglutathione lyase family enzyme